MKEGTDYVIRTDPQGGGEDDWVVVLSDPFDGVVCRYRKIQITGKGKKLSFQFERLHCPESCVLIGREEELRSTLTDVLVNVLQEHHEKKANVYYNMKTGERVDYE